MNGIDSSSASPASAKLTRKQRRSFDRAFERIRGKDRIELQKRPLLLLFRSAQHDGNFGYLCSQFNSDHGLSLSMQ